MNKIGVAGVGLLAVLLILSGYVSAQGPDYQDGIYEGQHSFVKVRVTVKDGKIADIEILHHGGGGEKYEKMIAPLLARIIEKQTLDIDSITGAIVSSDNLKQAIVNALGSEPIN